MRGLSNRRTFTAGALAGLASLLAVPVAGATTPGTAATAGASGTAPSGTSISADEWNTIVEAAKAEGEVTIYSSQALDNLENFGKAFQDEYGIKVNVFRGIDSDLHAKIQAERDSNSPIADLVVQATGPWQVAHSDEGWFTPVALPNFDQPGYNKAMNISPKSDYFVSNAAILTFGWNTELLPDGMKDYTDLLNPDLKGQIGVIEPANGAIVDFWLYLEEKYGADFTDKLAAQEPRIYPSSLPMGEALTSGEIAAASFVQIQDDAKAQGAPVDSGLSDTVWGAIFNAAVMANAPHPNAAKLLANFVISPAGQQAISHRAASSLPNIEGTPAITTDSVRRQDTAKLTPEFLAEYQARWKSLFQG